MVSLTLFLVAVSSLVFSKNFLGDYFSPPAVYSFFWSISLGFLTLGWVSFDTLGNHVWTVILVSYLAFMSGTAVVALYGFSRKHWLNAEPELALTDRFRFERALKILFLLGILGFLLQVAHLQASVGLQTFLTAPDLARESHSNLKYLGFFNVLNVANFVLALVYLVLYKRPGKWVVLILIWALLTTFLTTDRTRFFYMVIWSFYVVIYLLRRVDLSPKVILSACITLLLLLGFFVLIAKIYKKQAFADNMEFVNIPQQYEVLVDPYIYLTGSFPVLQAFLNDSHEPTYGKHSLSPIVKLIELFYPLFQREDIVGKFYRVPIELNACTYLQPFYQDFGFAGILIGPFLMGLLSMWAYVAMRQRKTIFSVYLSSLLSFCITISIFVNHFSQITTWYFVAVGYCVYRYTLANRAPSSDALRKIIYA